MIRISWWRKARMTHLSQTLSICASRSAGAKNWIQPTTEFSGCTNLECTSFILMHRRHFPSEWISITLNRRFPELSKSLHPRNIRVKTGPDWKLERSAEILFSDVFSAKWRPFIIFHQRCTDWIMGRLSSSGPFYMKFPQIWSSFKQCLISIVEFKNSLPSTRSDLSVRCWLIVWWNWFIHVFTLRPRQSSSLYQQLPSHIHCLHCSYYINSYYCAISAIISLYQQLPSHIHCSHCWSH